MKRGVLALVTAVAVGVAGVPALAKAGGFTRHQYGNPGRPGARIYFKYVPAHLGKRPVPLLVMLHGCLQTASDLAVQTRFNALADRERFIVVYPEQNRTASSTYPLADGNGSGCWNWFLPDHQARDAGEPASIAGITREVMRRHRIDRRRVFIHGLSAGADMAVIMAATYPDLYAAVGAIAGCPYSTCADATGELTVRAMGPRARTLPMFTSQGSTDTLNVVPLGGSLVQSWLGVADRTDDGSFNGSVSRVPSSIEHRSLQQTPRPGTGDACVRPSSWTCPGGVVGLSEYPHSIMRYETARCVVVESWLIHGLTHAYPKGDPSKSFSDPLGPDITRAAWRFFEQHPRGACA